MKKTWKTGIVCTLLMAAVLCMPAGMPVAADTVFADDDGTGNWGWASPFIYKCADRGILEGFEDRTFRIEENLTREQAAKIIAEGFQLGKDEEASQNPGGTDSTGGTDNEGSTGNTEGADSEGSTGNTGGVDGTNLMSSTSLVFSDLSEFPSWALPYITRCVDAGVINGYDDGTFRPKKPVSRAEFSKLLSQAADLSKAQTGAKFRDDDGSGGWGWASPYIYACYEAGIVGGYEEGSFRPDNPVTRGQAARMLAIASGLADAQAVTDRQKSAVADAKARISSSVYSFTGLMEALMSERRYSESEARYGAIYCGADWNSMALQRAQSIIGNAGNGSMLRDDFIALMTDRYGFTQKQAEYAADRCGATWQQPTEVIPWNSSWKYADYSKIHGSSVTLYRAQNNRKNIVVAVNAGHGTSGGTSVKTLCHPDGSAKVTGGSTAAGAKYAASINEGTTMSDGTPERTATLKLALMVKEDLLNAGYDVLMLRETTDTRLDNLARTVIANNCADCHIAIHYDSTSSNKGLFYCGVPNNSRYRNMEPVKSHWREHEALGQAVLSGMRANGVKIWSNGNMQTDLTQTSYSTVPSAVVEVGDKTSSRSDASLRKISAGFVRGVELYFS